MTFASPALQCGIGFFCYSVLVLHSKVIWCSSSFATSIASANSRSRPFSCSNSSCAIFSAESDFFMLFTSF
nr:MAG TPA: hypothetical protein [Caudoviricetes sp.]